MDDNADMIVALATDAAVTAGLLDIGRTIALTSGALLLIATSFWILGYATQINAFYCSFIAALMQAYFAQRVRFDAAILSFWAQRWNQVGDPAGDLRAFDLRIGRRPAMAGPVQQDLAQRRQGALRLLRYQVFNGIAQLLLTVVTFWP